MTGIIETYSNRFGSEVDLTCPGAQYTGIIHMAVKKSSGLVVKELEFHNLIMQAGYNGMGQSSAASLSTHCRVGTGTSEPNELQVDLDARTGGVSGTGGSDVTTNSGAAPWYIDLTRVYVFSPGAATGNITEIGFFSNSGSSAPMFSRALVKDENGIPSAITVLADEYLYVTYTIRGHVGSLDDVSGEIMLDGTLHTYNVRKFGIHTTNGVFSPQDPPRIASIYNVYNSPSQMGLTDVSPTGSSSNSNTSAQLAYVNNSFRRGARTSMSPSQGNLSGGINQIYGSSSLSSTRSGFSVFFTPNIAKNSSKSLQLDVWVKWGPYVP